ncbi:MAG: acyl-CoA thioesterase [Ottowia sp.]|nr:acyl-CoA thioesterase [Ottowia sp.]
MRVATRKGHRRRCHPWQGTYLACGWRLGAGPFGSQRIAQNNVNRPYAGRYVVTLSVDQVTFLQPIHVGELVTFLASVNYTGRTSMEVGIKVVTENIREQVVRHANSCFFAMVTVDESGRPASVPPLQLQTQVQKRRQHAAQLRRDLRKELGERFEQARVAFPGGD